MNHDEIDALADRLLASIVAGDVDDVRSIYATDATIWHNFDQIDQTPDQSLRTLAYLRGLLSGMRYEDVRRTVLDDGYVQQHVLRATGPKGDLEIPAVLRVYVAGGLITRIEEYLDPAPFVAAIS